MKPVRLRDRLTGTVLDPRVFDGRIPDGRYSVTQAMDYGGHSRLDAGDLLLDDGSAGPGISGGRIDFKRPQISELAQDDLALAFDALAAIDARTNLAAGQWPSPLLPSELDRESDTGELDRLLAEVFEQGHLDSIAARPRLSMRYDREVLPVGRAHRLDGAFERYLSAHSEHWAARTLSGILPKAVLARISDDDPNIYEHQVYARLLDHLERYLRRRMNRLSNIGDRVSKALAFQNSEQVNYRVRDTVCRVWGEAVDPGDAGQLLARNEQRLQTLGRWLRRIRRLMQRRVQDLHGVSLYGAIPRGAQVGLNLAATNLLTHDPHYRQLRLLWRSWLQATADEREHPVQVLDRRLAEQARYETYIGLLLVRGLRELGFAVHMSEAHQGEAHHEHWGEQAQLSFVEHAWSLVLGDRSLVLIPAAVALDQETASYWTTHVQCGGAQLRVPCVLRLPQDQCSAPPFERAAQGAPALQATPLDLYTEEAMVTLLSAWLWQGRLSGYGEQFTRLPPAVIDAWPQGTGGEPHGLALHQSMDAAQWGRLSAALDRLANQDLNRRIRARKIQIDRLNVCPECAQAAFIFEPVNSGFYARCHCGFEWKLDGGRFTQKQRGDFQQPSFETLGRRLIDIEAG